jgi:nucleoside-diphosphate-sugar epimerase
LPKDENDYCPPNFYGESKVIGEKLVKAASNRLNYNWIIIRPTSIWGPWFGPTYRLFFEMIIKRRYFNFTGKMSDKTYGYIGNSVYQIDKLLMSNSNHGKTFYIGDYASTNIKEWAVEIAKEMNYSLVSIPRPIIWLSAKIGDFLKYFNLRFPMNSFRYKNMTTDNLIPLDETRKLAPLTLFTRIEGNRLTIKWMHDHYFKNKQVRL